MKIDFRNWSADQLIETLEETGYSLTKNDKSILRDDGVKYIGFSNGNHHYLILCQDDDESWLVTTVHISLGASGIIAEYAGCPRDDNLSEDAARELFERICN